MAETYWELVETAAREHPGRVVLADDFGRSLTCEELRDAASRTAAAFFEYGVTDGTVVTWQLPTTLETMVVMVALARLGAVQNPVLPHLAGKRTAFRDNPTRHRVHRCSRRSGVDSTTLRWRGRWRASVR